MTTSRLTRQLEIDALLMAARWPLVDQRAVLTLASQLLATRRVRDGYDFFQERSAAQPESAIYLALEGLFQARLARDIPLLHRVHWINQALGKLDRAVQLAPGLTMYFRGIVLAELPRRFGRGEAAIADLEWVLAHKDQFPIGLRRAVYRGLARAYQTLGRGKAAQEALAHSGYASTEADEPQFVTDAWYTLQDGLRFVPRRIVRPAPGIHVAQGYDFSDLAFIETEAGLVAIDAGSAEAHARAALDDLRRSGVSQSISHVILTHAHWDHVGGLGAFLEPGVQVVARANFASELRIGNETGARIQRFFGQRDPGELDVRPTHVVSAVESLTIGGVQFGLHPVRGGETEDGLLIHVPAFDVLFVGDVLMPMLGAPFLPEGSIDGLFETLHVIRTLAPARLIHGHPPLTETFSIDALAGLEAALHELHAHVLRALREGRTLIETLRDNMLPESLREHPAAVLPFVVMRDNVIQRLYAQRSGYWQSDGDGVEVFADDEWAAAVDLLGGRKESAFRRSVTRLLDTGEPGLALKLADLGLARYAESGVLRALRQRALHRLRERYQTVSPFKFILYSGLAEAELQPVQ